MYACENVPESEKLWEEENECIQQLLLDSNVEIEETIEEEFSVPQIEYPPGSSKKGSHVYFLLQTFWVIILFCQIVLFSDINVVLMS